MPFKLMRKNGGQCASLEENDHLYFLPKQPENDVNDFNVNHTDIFRFLVLFNIVFLMCNF